jgi:hypothetical protein
MCFDGTLNWYDLSSNATCCGNMATLFRLLFCFVRWPIFYQMHPGGCNVAAWRQHSFLSQLIGMLHGLLFPASLIFFLRHHLLTPWVGEVVSTHALITSSLLKTSL